MTNASSQASTITIDPVTGEISRPLFFLPNNGTTGTGTGMGRRKGIRILIMIMIILLAVLLQLWSEANNLHVPNQDATDNTGGTHENETHGMILAPKQTYMHTHTTEDINITAATTITTTQEEVENQNQFCMTAVLDLLPWEEASISRQSDTGNETLMGSCMPPNRIPSACCLGSASRGGGVHNFPRQCAKEMDVYTRTKDLALEHLSFYQHPISALESESAGNLYNKCDICQIFNIAASHNLTVAFTGDSMQSQTFMGLECELRRRGFQVKATTEKYKVMESARWRYGVKHLSKLTVTVPSLDLDEAKSHNRTVEFRYFMHYRPLEEISQNQSEYRDIAENTDIVIFDFGLHYNYEDYTAYVDSVKTVLTIMKNTSTFVIHRETSAQHYDTNAGDYQSDVSNVCVPTQGDSKKLGFRTKAVTAAAITANYSVFHGINGWTQQQQNYVKQNNQDELVILPFYNFTEQLFFLHLGDECTHYCSTPYLWLPLWRHLRFAMERKYSKNYVAY